jgi:hypothetical protein
MEKQPYIYHTTPGVHVTQIFSFTSDPKEFQEISPEKKKNRLIYFPVILG